MEQAPKASQAPPSRGMVLFSVSFYMVTAIIMIMVNKAVLNSASLPLTFLFLQIVLAVVLLHFSQMCGWLTLPELDRKTCKALWPLIAVNVIGLASNTFTLQMVDASFYQVARALVLPFTVTLSWVVLKQPSSRAVLLCCLVVCAGFVTGVTGELGSLKTTALGVFFGVFSSATTAAHTIVIKKSLEIVGNVTLDLVYYNSVLSAAALLPLCVFAGELPEARRILSAEEEDGADLRTLTWGVLITGLFGFLINVAGFLQVKVTSPITHCISSAVRGVLQTMVAVILFGDVVTVSRAWGILLILAGGAAYTVVRDRELKRKWATGGAAGGAGKGAGKDPFSSPPQNGRNPPQSEATVALIQMEEGASEEHGVSSVDGKRVR